MRGKQYMGILKAKRVILLGDIVSGFSRGILRGIVKYAHLHGPWIMDRSRPYHQIDATMLEELRNWKPDGIITRINRVPREMIEMGIPIVTTDEYNQIVELPKAVKNSEAIGKMGAEHFLERSFQNFAYCGYDHCAWSHKCCSSFVKKIEQEGFETHLYKSPHINIDYLWENEEALIAKWLKSLPKPLGIMTANDDRAATIIESCRLANLHVPEEIAVLGVDNDELICNLSLPQLSSIAVNIERAGYKVAEILDNLMNGIPIENDTVVVEPTYVATRESTDITAIEDREIAEAIRFIRQNSRRMLQVDDIANVATLSRRVLQQRFMKALGRTVHSEIRRVRIQRITQMLVETDLSISQIALALDFKGVKHIARYFRREKGVSPQEYRRKYGRK